MWLSPYVLQGKPVGKSLSIGSSDTLWLKHILPRPNKSTDWLNGALFMEYEVAFAILTSRTSRWLCDTHGLRKPPPPERSLPNIWTYTSYRASEAPAQ